MQVNTKFPRFQRSLTGSGRLLLAVNTIGSLNLRPFDLLPRSVGQLVQCPLCIQQSPVLRLLGWVSIFARLSVCASTAFVAAQMIQGLMILNNENYEPLRWQGTMLYWMILLIAVLVNILGIRVFPHIETAACLFHICFFFVLLVPLVYLSPRSSARFVFADFENSGGWNNNGVSWCIGLLTSAWAFTSEQHVRLAILSGANILRHRWCKPYE